MNDAIKQRLKKSGYPDRAEFEWSEFIKGYEAEIGHSLPAIEASVQLATLFGQSFFLVQQLLQEPQLAERLLHSDFLEKGKSYGRFLTELESALETVQGDRESLARVLRHYRYEETLRMTVRELADLDSFELLGRERSELAAACVEASVGFLTKELEREYGKPFDSSGEASTFAVLGMGKLGGEDLNYSSDIDLIYFYSDDEGCFSETGGEADITHHEYFVRLGEMLTRLLSERTADGFVYRVDTDLRPEGQKGTLANSLRAMETYYESFGGNWERMAMTKARVVGGNSVLGERLWNAVRPFVYPKVTDYSTLEQVRDLKHRIEQSVQQKLAGGVDPKNAGYNVKLGIGGIRELEFFVGAFQRLYGGQHESLQERNTLRALEALNAKQLISQADGNTLAQAYRFLRQVENRLQILDERQTHSLPRSREDLEALANNLFHDEGNRSTALDKFQSQLILHTENIRLHFERLFEQTS